VRGRAPRGRQKTTSSKGREDRSLVVVGMIVKADVQMVSNGVAGLAQALSGHAVADNGARSRVVVTKRYERLWGLKLTRVG